MAGKKKKLSHGTKVAKIRVASNSATDTKQTSTRQVVSRSPAARTTKAATGAVASLEEQARAVRAQKALVELAELRLVHKAGGERKTQKEIAHLLGVSQPTVSRMAQKIKQTPRAIQTEPREIINQRTVGRIDSLEMMSLLVSFDYEPARYDPTSGDGFLRGDWHQIEDALVNDLITDEEYEKLAYEVATKNPTSASE